MKMKVIDKIRKKYPDLNIFMICVGVCLAIISLALLAMMFFAIASSFSELLMFERYPLKLFASFKAENYKNVFLYMQVKKLVNGQQVYIKAPRMYLNSLLYAIGVSFGSVIVMCTTAYMCSKYKNFFSKIVKGIVIVTMIIPIIGSTPSAVNIMYKLRLYNHIFGVCIQKCSFLGVYFLLFVATFDGVANDYGEAAQIDGASQLFIYLRIYLPLVRNMFFTMVLINFIGSWNDYQTPLLFMPDKPTISYGLYYLTQYPDNRFNGDTPLFLAAAILVASPTVILFCIFHKRLLGNLSMGGIKG